MIDLSKFRPFASLVLDLAKKAAGGNPALTTVLGGLSSVMEGVPDLAADKVKVDAALDDAIKGRRAAGDRALDALKKR